MTELRDLNLGETQIDGTGLKHLRGMKNLTDLYLTENNLRGTNLVHLIGLPLKKLLCWDAAIYDDDVKHLAAMTTLEQLEISRTNVTDIGLSQLNGLPNLRYFTADRTGITAAGRAKFTKIPLTDFQLDDTPAVPDKLAALPVTDQAVVKLDSASNELLRKVAGLGKVQELHVGSYRGSSFGLSHLKNLPKLRIIRFESALINDAGLQYLAEITSLTSLTLLPQKYIATGVHKIAHHRITNASLSALKTLLDLETLELPRTRIDDDGLRLLAQFKKLRTLDLSHSQVTDAGVLALKTSAIEHLTLSDCAGITDAALEAIKGIPQLKSINLSGTKVTQKALDNLRKQKPNLKIEF